MIFLVLLLLFLFLVWLFRAQYVQGVPLAEGALPIVGHLFVLQKNGNRYHEFLLECAEKHNEESWGLSFPGTAAVFLVKPEQVKYMLETKFDNFIKSDDFQYNYHEILGQGIFSANGPSWRKQRKISSHLFSQRVLREKMATSFTRHLDSMCSFLDANLGNEIDMQSVFFSFTMDAICDIAFSHDLNSLNNTSMGVDENGVPTGRQFCADFDLSNGVSMERFFVPPFVTKLKQWLGVFGIGREGKMRSAMVRMNSFLNVVLQQRLADNSDAHDILSMFQKAGEADLRDVITNFLIAGRDTTAWALTAMFYLLSKHPKVEQNVRDEIEAVLQGGAPTLDSCKKLMYTKAVFYETMRLYPSVPYDSKKCVADCVFPGGISVKAGQDCGYPSYVHGRLKSIWGEDAGDFKPERFLDGGEFKQPDQFKFTSFNAGPRLCLGRTMAALEVCMATAQLLPQYRFKLVPGHKVEMPLSATFSFQHGMKMTFQKI